MLDQLIAWLNLMLSVVGATAPIGAAGFAGGAVAAVLVIACVAIAALSSAAHGHAARPREPHPRRAIDVSTPLLQSDPDAPGHPRPRAPQGVAAA